MKIYNLHREQFLPVSIATAWSFFSSPDNLAVITPPELKFVVLTKFDRDAIYSGMFIDYTVSPLLGIPLKWRTEIMDVKHLNTFVDRQVRGPYAKWEHTHSFTEVQGGVNMIDDIKYALPLGILGSIAHTLIVQQKLKKIFDFRETKLRELFGT